MMMNFQSLHMYGWGGGVGGGWYQRKISFIMEERLGNHTLLPTNSVSCPPIIHTTAVVYARVGQFIVYVPERSFIHLTVLS